MTITVTQKHIDEAAGTRQWGHCPIARALKDAGFKRPVVTSTWDVVTLEKNYELPPRALEFLWQYDNGAQVEPFAFEIQEAGE